MNNNNTILINANDKEYFEKCFEIGFLYDTKIYNVYANNEQNALDTLIDYFEANDLKGYYMTFEELEQYEISEDECIVAGNHCYYIQSHELAILKEC